MGEARPDGEESVVLVDDDGTVVGRAPKASVHHAATPLHVGFSCYAIHADGRLLVTRRASTKRTWPGTWSNTCCGHPAPGESLAAAVARRLDEELGLAASDPAVVLGRFRYRAEMGGVVEHELCPVVAVRVEDEPRPNPDEVDEVRWCRWEEFARRAREAPDTLSPWSVEQVAALEAAGRGAPAAWWTLPPTEPAWFALDEPIGAAPATGRVP